MDIRQQTNVSTRQNSASFEIFDRDLERVNNLIALNSKIADEERIYRNYQERFQAALVKHPITTEKAFAYFGLMLGIFPPAAIFFQLFKNNPETGLIVLFTLVNFICAVAGYFGGKLIGKLAKTIELYSWHKMILLMPLLGILWGMIAGGSGGFLIFIVGAFFGALCAAAVGAVAIPAFTIFHRILKHGEIIERNEFFPLSVGIALTVAAFILGL